MIHGWFSPAIKPGVEGLCRFSWSIQITPCCSPTWDLWTRFKVWNTVFPLLLLLKIRIPWIWVQSCSEKIRHTTVFLLYCAAAAHLFDSWRVTDLKATTSPLLGEISNVISVKNSVVSLEIRTGYNIHTVYFKILTLVITDAFTPNPEGPQLQLLVSI